MPKGNKRKTQLQSARTHTAKVYSLQDFRKGIGGNCPVDSIEYIDANGVRHVIDCYFTQGPNKGKSKGLVEICKELDVKLPEKVKLADIYQILAKHPAFQNVSQTDFIFSDNIPLDLLYFKGYKIRDVG